MPSEVSAYVAQVTGVQGRAIKAKSTLLSDKAGTNPIQPLVWGSGVKLSTPAVGDQVLVISIDALNNNRYYLPLGSVSQVSNDADPTGKVVIGTGATEPGVLGNQLVTLLNNLLTDIENMTVMTSFGPAPVSPASITIFQTLAQTVNNILSQLLVLK